MSPKFSMISSCLSLIHFQMARFLTFESNVQHILSLSSILLLQKNRMLIDLKKYLVNESANHIVSHARTSFGMDK
jgi:hypothetical protein